MFDKIGTLTQGHAQIDTALLSPDQVSVLVRLCAGSGHPVSRVIVAAMSMGVVPANVTEICELAGAGVEGHWNGQVVCVGRCDWVGATTSPALAIGETTAVSLTFAEALRDGAIDAVNKLRDAGYHVAVFTEDNVVAAATLAQKLGVADARADMRPEEKLAAIEALRTQGHHVLMVGDGLNDTAASAVAHASMSPASALDVSRAVSDILPLGRSLAEILDAVTTGKSARVRVIENFAIAVGYNAIAIPIAVMAFATTLDAAVAMSLSSVTVLLNALRLR